MKTKALFFDIDGTLVSFNTHLIPQSAVDAIASARESGVKVFISTGRPQVLINCLQQLQEPGLIDGYITMNGGYCFSGDKVISKRPMRPADVSRVWDFCNAKSLTCIAIREHDIRINMDSQLLQDIFYRDLRCTASMPVAPKADAISGHDIFQLTPFIDADAWAELAPTLEAVESGRWHPAFADLTVRGCTKSKGMDDFASAFGFDISETMAFGDGGNDITMLQHAGIGIAMGNAGDAVKASASDVTASVDDDGIALALKKYGII